MKDYKGALEFYQKWLKINPKNASTFTALGLTFHLIGEIKKAL